VRKPTRKHLFNFQKIRRESYKKDNQRFFWSGAARASPREALGLSFSTSC